MEHPFLVPELEQHVAGRFLRLQEGRVDALLPEPALRRRERRALPRARGLGCGSSSPRWKEAWKNHPKIEAWAAEVSNRGVPIGRCEALATLGFPPCCWLLHRSKILNMFEQNLSKSGQNNALTLYPQPNACVIGGTSSAPRASPRRAASIARAGLDAVGQRLGWWSLCAALRSTVWVTAV